MSQMGRVLGAVQQSTDQLAMMIRDKYMMPGKIDNSKLIARNQAAASKQLKGIGASVDAVAQLFNAMEDHAIAESGLFKHLTKHGLAVRQDTMQTVNSLTTNPPKDRGELVDSLHQIGCKGLDESVADFFDSLARAEKEYGNANQRVAEDILNFLAKPLERQLQDIVRGILDSYQRTFLDFVDDPDEEKLAIAKDSAMKSLVEIGASHEGAEKIVELQKTSLSNELFYVNHLERSGVALGEAVASDIGLALESYKDTRSIEASLAILERHGYDSSADERDLETVVKELVEVQEAFNEEYQNLIKDIATKIAEKD